LQTLLIDLLISRSPSSLALLRAAYSHRQQYQSRSGSISPPSSFSATSTATRSLDVAVLSAYAGNVKLRKAWEVALQGRWDDQPEGEEEEDEGAVTEEVREAREDKRKKLFREDLDQLKVALRRGGNVEIV
jgi:hypothetical protein